MAGALGIKPRLRDSKSPVLSLHNAPTNYTYFLKNMIDFSTEEPSVTEVNASVNTFVVLEQQKNLRTFVVRFVNSDLVFLLYYRPPQPPRCAHG